MSEILMYVSNGLVEISFLMYFIITFILGNKKITDSNGFNITKDILSDYNQINIIENNSYFTVYNIKRKVIKIATRCYYGNTIRDIVIALVEAGTSGIDNDKNKVINFFRKIVPNLKVLYILSIVAVGINSITYNINDAKISLIFLSLFLIISYLIIGIRGEASEWLNKRFKKIKEINKVGQAKILKQVNNIYLLDKLIFFGELIMIIRCVIIIIK